MFNKIELDELFQEACSSVYDPSKELITAIIRQAIHDEDWEFFKSDTFKWYCGLLGCDWQECQEYILQKAMENK